MRAIEGHGSTAAQRAEAYGEVVSSAASSSREATAEEAALLPEPLPVAVGGDPGADIAMLLVEAARQDRKMGRAMRQAEEAAQRRAEDAELGAMAEKAEAARASGIAGGFAAGLSGLVSIAGASSTAQQARPSAAYSGAAELIGASGKLATASFDYTANLADVDATKERQSAGRHERAAADALDAMKDATALLDRAISYYKEYMTAKADAQRAAILRA